MVCTNRSMLAVLILTCPSPSPSPLLPSPSLPPLPSQGMARMCCDPRRNVRHMAISYLQRALLAHDLQRLSPNEWEACFLEVRGPTGEGGGMWEGSSVWWWVEECVWMVVGGGVRDRELHCAAIACASVLLTAATQHKLEQ